MGGLKPERDVVQRPATASKKLSEYTTIWSKREDLVLEEISRSSGDPADGMDPEIAKLLVDNEESLRQIRCEVRDTATAMGKPRKGDTSREVQNFAPAARRGRSTVDVLTIGEGTAGDSEWHHTT